ncbi:hypothetical protein FXO37_03084 [Capsicum annuum]|nr:hypothetical protein FXO37_03084 [Capsicum annuum]
MTPSRVASDLSYQLDNEADDKAEPMAMIIPRPMQPSDFVTVNSSDAKYSSDDNPLLPWFEVGHASTQVTQSPDVLDTSRWTKTVMFKACKAFGINAVGFEHEILDMVLQMEQKRQSQIEQRKPSSNTRNKGKKKQSSELERLS